jgi:hypothetical protein
MRRIPLVALALAATAAPEAAFGQTPLGAAVAINSNTAGTQSAPDVALRSNGAGWVVWSTFGGAPGAPNVAIRNFDAAGNLGTEFVHNQHTDGDQREPQIEVSVSGYPAMAWKSVDQFGSSSDEDAIVRWAYDNNYQPEILGQASSTPDPDAVDVAIHSDESFVSVWREGTSIRAHRFSHLGDSLGDDELVATNVIATHFDVAALPYGRSVVVFNASGGDYGVYGRILAEDGTALGFPFPLSDAETSAQNEVSVAGSGTNGFVACWLDYAAMHVFARVFDAEGTPLTGDIQVTPTPLTVATRVRLGRGPDGGFVVAWTRRTRSRTRSISGCGSSVPRERRPVPRSWSKVWRARTCSASR